MAGHGRQGPGTAAEDEPPPGRMGQGCVPAGAHLRSERTSAGPPARAHLHRALGDEIHGKFERAVILWTLEPAEWDAVLANEEAKKFHPGGRALVEIACTRTPAQLFAAKEAYHERFKRSLEEDVAAHVTGDFRKVRASETAETSERAGGSRASLACAGPKSPIRAVYARGGLFFPSAYFSKWI